MKAACNTAVKNAESIQTLPGDNFQKILDAVKTCAKDFAETEMVWEDVQKDWKQVATMYGKDADKLKPEAFFATINAFLTAFQASIDAEVKKKQDEASEKGRQEALNAKRAEVEAKKAALELKKAELAKKNQKVSLDLVGSTLEDAIASATPRDPSAKRDPNAPTPRNRAGSGGKSSLQRGSAGPRSRGTHDGASARG